MNLLNYETENPRTHLRMFSHDTPENCSIQVHLDAYSHNTQTRPHLLASSCEIFFHAQPRIPLTVPIYLCQNQFRECSAQNCSDLTYHSKLQPTDLNLLFQSNSLKPISTWFLANKTTMLQKCSKVSQ